MVKSERIKDIEFGNNSVEAKFDVHSGGVKGSILLLPGIGSGPFGGIFDQFVEKAVEENFQVLRYESWEDVSELQEKTVDSIFAEINDAVDYLKDRNDLKVFIVAKSFSAGMVLAGSIDNVDKTVLWAPAVGFQEKANIEELRDSKLGEVEEVTDIQINSEFLEHKVPVKVIHGENDQVVQIENSESIVHNLPEAEIKRISETGHSYEGKKNLVIEETIEFLNQ